MQPRKINFIATTNPCLPRQNIEYCTYKQNRYIYSKYFCLEGYRIFGFIEHFWWTFSLVDADVRQLDDKR